MGVWGQSRNEPLLGAMPEWFCLTRTPSLPVPGASGLASAPWPLATPPPTWICC